MSYFIELISYVCDLEMCVVKQWSTIKRNRSRQNGEHILSIWQMMRRIKSIFYSRQYTYNYV